MKVRADMSNRGATLVEAMIGFGIGMMGIVFFLSIYTNGARMFKFQTIRMQAANQAAFTFSAFNHDVRMCNSNSIGDLTNGTFRASTNANPSGNYMYVYTNSSPTNPICYYYLPASNKLYRANGFGAIMVLASSVTNTTNVFVGYPTGNNLLQTSITLQFFTTNEQTRLYFNNVTNILTFKTTATGRRI